MKALSAWLTVLLAAVLVAATGCARRPAPDPPQVTLGAFPASALVISTSHPRADLPAIARLICHSARPQEHLEVVDRNYRSGRVLLTRVAPPAPVMTGPAPPRRPPGGASAFQVTRYRHQYQAYEGKVAADRHVLQRLLARSLGGWCASARAWLAHTAPGADRGAHPRAGLSDAMAFFSSLAQGRTHLGDRKVIVIFATEATPDQALPVRPDSLSGAAVVISNFRGGTTAQGLWRADLRKAGAGHAVILVPAAASELPAIVSGALTGGAGGH